MAAEFTDFLETAIVDHFFRGSAKSTTSAFVGLFTAAPSEAGGGTEVAGGSYARQAAGFSAPSPAGQTSNAADVTFPTASGSWGTVTHVGIFDALSGGNLLAFKALSSSVAVGIGQQPRFVAAALALTVT